MSDRERSDTNTSNDVIPGEKKEKKNQLKIKYNNRNLSFHIKMLKIWTRRAISLLGISQHNPADIRDAICQFTLSKELFL